MKKSFQTEMDDTQQAVSQIVCLCTTIALHQEFGVGKTRLAALQTGFTTWKIRTPKSL